MSTAIGVFVLVSVITVEMIGIWRELKKIHQHLDKDKEEDKKVI